MPKVTELKTPGPRPNECLVTDNVVTSARNLIQGYPLTPINFADLCNFIEMVILHQRIIMTIPALTDSPLESFVDQEIITSTMFKNATPPSEEDKVRLETIYIACLRTLGEGGIFGRGIVNVPEKPDEELESALSRIKIGELILRYESGVKVEPGAEKALKKIYELYQVFKDYADSVFDAARYFHVNAYTGSSEVPCAIQNVVKSVPQALYTKLKELHKERVNSFLVESGFHTYDIPPFASIVLSRCKSRDDIVPQMLTAREEFTDFRNTCTQYAEDLEKAAKCGTNEDIIQIHNDIDQAIGLLTKKAKATELDTRFIYRVWDVVKEASPWGIGTKILDRLTEWDIDRRSLQSVNGMLDVWQKLKKGSTYEKILRSKLFAGDFQKEEFVAYDKFLEHIRGYMNVPVMRKHPSTAARVSRRK